MSRYGVNKALWVVGRDDAQAAVYMETPEVFLADYSLTPEEHRQLMERDFAGMFADGAHPFLLGPTLGLPHELRLQHAAVRGLGLLQRGGYPQLLNRIGVLEAHANLPAVRSASLA